MLGDCSPPRKRSSWPVLLIRLGPQKVLLRCCPPSLVLALLRLGLHGTELPLASVAPSCPSQVATTPPEARRLKPPAKGRAATNRTPPAMVRRRSSLAPKLTPFVHSWPTPSIAPGSCPLSRVLVSSASFERRRACVSTPPGWGCSCWSCSTIHCRAYAWRGWPCAISTRLPSLRARPRVLAACGSALPTPRSASCWSRSPKLG